MRNAPPIGATSPAGSPPVRPGWPRRNAPGWRRSEMPSRSAFSYSVLRVVPDIEREEFVNAGLILFARERRFLAARSRYDEAALDALQPGCDHAAILRQLEMIEQVAAGTAGAAPFDTMSQ